MRRNLGAGLGTPRKVVLDQIDHAESIGVVLFCRIEAEGNVLHCSDYLIKRVPTNFGDSLKICNHFFLYVSVYNIQGTVNLLIKIMSQ